MAQPEKGLEKWELRKLRELGVQHWKDAADAKAKMKAAMQDRAKKNEEKQKGGFEAVDAKADDKPVEKKSDAPAAAAVVTKPIEVLPATQTVDVSAPQIVVNVPAPGVTITNDNFAFYPFAKAAFTWVQAAVIGAAIYSAMSSRLSELVISQVIR